VERPFVTADSTLGKYRSSLLMSPHDTQARTTELYSFVAAGHNMLIRCDYDQAVLSLMLYHVLLPALHLHHMLHNNSSAQRTYNGLMELSKLLIVYSRKAGRRVGHYAVVVAAAAISVLAERGYVCGAAEHSCVCTSLWCYHIPVYRLPAHCLLM
jgi:hypothetical protein